MHPKSVIVFLAGLLSALWLLNLPVVGNLDDMIPFIGNLDEAAAALVLINCLAYFGFDLTRFIKPVAGAAQKKPKAPPAGPVVDIPAETVRR